LKPIVVTTVGSFFYALKMKKANKSFGFFLASSYLCIKYEQNTGSAIAANLLLEYNKQL